MKTSCLLITIVLFVAPLSAAPTAKDAHILMYLPECAGATVSHAPFGATLPAGMTGTVVTMKSDDPRCQIQRLALTTKGGHFYFGAAWPLDELTGTPAERLRQFGLTQLNEVFTVTVGKTPIEPGLLPVEMASSTEYGKLRMFGVLDAGGRMFFPGEFRLLSSDPQKRLSKLEPLFAKSPSLGNPLATVRIVEFSDFECPSCKMMSSLSTGLLEKWGDRILYTRYDYPLIGNHPWAFAAAAAGRAIHRQNPEAFWKFKKQTYDNQDKLNAFVFEEFARGFVQDHGLNLDKYTADVQSAELRQEILDGVGLASLVPVHGTPTFMINGRVVPADEDGKNLDNYIAGLLGTKPDPKKKPAAPK